ncbi:MAG TPA: hypothetical protein DE179_11840 [Oceanospirillaceae bacterium]|nr:hypothetical protein [Oceanospirillaceae bacterium]
MPVLKRYKWLVAIALLVLVGYLMLKQYQSSLNDELNRTIRDAEANGAAYGLQHDQTACMEQSLRNIQGCSGFACGVVHGRYFKACLEQAPVSANFCNDVPSYAEEKDRDTKKWLRDVCFEHPETNICYQLMRQRQRNCGA